MLLDMAINFCVLFTFTALTFWTFQSEARFRIPFRRFHPLLVGLASGFTGIVLIQTSVQVSDQIIVDARTVVIVISGIISGPWSPLISGMMIGLFRIFRDGMTDTSLIAGLNTIVASVVVVLLMLKRPMTLSNVHKYYFYFSFQTAIILFSLLGLSWTSLLSTLFFIGFSLLSFFTVLFILKELDIHFKNIQLVEKLSETDFLTGLYNNRKFQTLAAALLAKREPFSLILLDIDHFKKVNDTYGHPIGDEILCELASRLRRAVSPQGGIVSRNGGEEFSVLLPGYVYADSKDVAESIRQAVASVPFTTTTKLELSITISLGIATFPENGLDTQQLYNLADIAMYEAKETGRNKSIHIDDKKRGA